MDAFFEAAETSTKASTLASEWFALLERRGASALCLQVGDDEWWVGSRRGARHQLGACLAVYGDLRLRSNESSLIASLATLMSVWLGRIDRFSASSRRAQSERKSLRAELGAVRSRRLLGDSPVMQHVRAQIRIVAPHPTTVAIFGESGTGKELAARMLHNASGRPGPLLVVNCSTLTPALADAQLFGHERGAFTGAHAAQQGLFVAARDGTLFLDEVAELGLEVQAKLLRALEARRVRAVGSQTEREFNARVVCATHRDLIERVRRGLFREDLYYRLVRFEVRLPALRERPEDIPRLVEQCLRRFATEQRREVPVVEPTLLLRMQRMKWPGNVRQLQNEIERALLMSDAVLRWTPAKEPQRAERTLAAVVRAALVDALTRTGGRVYGSGGAAEILGLPPSTLQAKLLKHGINRADFAGKRR